MYFWNGIFMLRSYAVVLGIVLLINSVLAVAGGVDASAFEQAKGSLQAAIASAKEKKDTTELVRLHEQLIELTERTFGSDSVEVAIELRLLGVVLFNAGEYERALPTFLRTLYIRTKVHGQEHLEVGKALNNVAVVKSRLQRYDQALNLYRQALKIQEKAFNFSHPELIRTLTNMAEAYEGLNDYKNALTIYKRKLYALENNLSEVQQLEVSYTLNKIGIMFENLGQFEDASEALNRSLKIHIGVFGKDHLEPARIMGNLAVTLDSLGKYDQSISLYEQSLRIIEMHIGFENEEIAVLLSNFGVTYDNLGEYEKALPLHQRSLDIYEKVQGVKPPGLRSTLMNLASTYIGLSKLDFALPLLERALTISEKVYGPDHIKTSLVLNNLAVVLLKQGNYTNARPLLLRALSISEKSQGGLQFSGRAMSNLGLSYFATKDYDQALTFYNKSILVREEVNGFNHPDTALSIFRLASLLMALKKYDEALPLYERSLAIREKVLGSEHPDSGNSYEGLGEFYRKQSLPDLAITFYKLAVNVRQSTRERVRRIGTAELESYTRSVETVYQDLAAILTEQGRLDEAQAVLELLKEDELFEFIRRSETKDLVRRKIRPTSTEQAWITQYRAIADRLFALGQEEQTLEKIALAQLTGEQRQRLAQIKADLKVAHQAFTHFMGELKNEALASKTERSADVEQLSPTAQSETREILQSLGDEVALVQYFVTDTELGMLVTTARLQKSYKSKIAAAELNLKIGSFLGYLRERKSQFPQKLSEELYQLLFAPMAADLAQAGIRTVMISGDGALRYVPFAALHDGKDYLIARYALPTYTSVTRGNLKESSQSVWTGAGLGVTQAHGDLKALPAVRAELHSIMGPAIPGEIYLDQAFTAKRLQEVGRQRLPVVHIASHFQFSPGTELNSFLLLGDGQTLNLGNFREGDYQLSGVDLLTLSACETGLGFGRDKKGREIEGFGVIAQQKGAKAVIATLWPVEDTSTSMLMSAVYRNRQTQGLTKIEALRQAQLSLKKQAKYAHPYYWAPFILMGNWK